MADQADGSIIIDTELDMTGFKAGSAELLRSIKSLNTKVKALGVGFRESLEKPISPKISTSQASADVTALKTQLRQIEKNIASLTSKLEQAKAKLSDYYAEQAEIRESTADMLKYASTSDQAKITYEIEEGQLNALNEKYASQLSTVRQIEESLEQQRQKLTEMQSAKEQDRSFEELMNDIDRTDTTADKLTNTFDRLKATNVSQNSSQWSNLAFSIQQALKQIYTYYDVLKSLRSDNAINDEQFNQASIAINAEKKRMQELLKETDKARGKLGFLSKAVHSIKESFIKLGKSVIGAASNLKRFSSSSKKASGGVNGLVKKITGLGSMLKRMVLRKIMMSMITAVKEGFSNLAQYSNQTNADLSALGSSLTRLKNSFAAAFAPILTTVTPVLSKLIDYISTALTYIGKLFAALTGAKTFTAAVAVQEDYAASLKGTSKAAKDAKKQLAGFDDLNVLSDSSSNSSEGSGSVDPSEMFEEVPIESRITDFVDRLKDAFNNGDWAGLAAIFTGRLNGMITTVNWSGIGSKIGYYLNGALSFLAHSVVGFDWMALGASLALCVNGVISNVDWGNLGILLSAKFRVILLTVAGFMQNLDWAALAAGFSDFAINFFNGITDAITAVDWQSLGRNVATFLSNVDWNGVMSALSEGIGAAIGGLAAFIWGLISDALSSVVSWWYDAAYEDGEFTMEGLLEGIWNGIKNIGSWIKENIFDPFINGFKTAFGIHSPSTVMAEQGGFLIDGLLNGITGAWSGIAGFFSTALSGLKKNLGEGWSSIASTTSTTWNSIKSTAQTICSKISGDVSSKFSSMGTTISSKVNDFKSTISTGFESAKSSITGKLDSAMSTVKNQGWSGVGSNICSGIASGIDSGWSGLTKKIGSVAGSLLESAKTALGIHSPSKLFHDVIGLNIGYGIGEGIEDSEGSILDCVSGVADAIADEFNAGEYSAIEMIPTGEIGSSLESFSNRITDSFTNLLDRLQAIANGVTFNTPVIAAKGAVPYSVSAAAGGDSGNITGAIEASNDELASVVTQVVANATTAIVGAIRSNGGTIVNLDAGSLATSVINEINRRTRMSGKSPLVG